MNIENIMVALFNKIDALRVAGTFVVASRKLEHINDYSPSNMPAVFQHQTNIGVTAPKNNASPKNMMHVDWYVYVSGAEDLAHSILLNPLIKAVCETLKPNPGDGTHCTLGGLVDNVYVDGTIEVYEGVLADRAVAIIPITILVPGY